MATEFPEGASIRVVVDVTEATHAALESDSETSTLAATWAAMRNKADGLAKSRLDCDRAAARTRARLSVAECARLRDPGLRSRERQNQGVQSLGLHGTLWSIRCICTVRNASPRIDGYLFQAGLRGIMRRFLIILVAVVIVALVIGLALNIFLMGKEFCGLPCAISSMVPTSSLPSGRAFHGFRSRVFSGRTGYRPARLGNNHFGCPQAGIVAAFQATSGLASLTRVAG